MNEKIENTIMMKDGKIVTKEELNMGSIIKNKKIRKHFKYLTKITKGMSSSCLNQDDEYLKFCDNITKKLIDDTIENINIDINEIIKERKKNEKLNSKKKEKEDV